MYLQKLRQVVVIQLSTDDNCRFENIDMTTDVILPMVEKFY